MFKRSNYNTLWRILSSTRKVELNLLLIALSNN